MDDLFNMVGGRTHLHDYVFSHTTKGFRYWAMGYGSLYSHSNNPNARWRIIYNPNGRETIEIRAVRNITKGEEITCSYTITAKNNPDELWFDVVE